MGNLSLFLLWLPGAALVFYIASIDLYAPEQLILAVVCTLALIGLRWHHFHTTDRKPSSLRVTRMMFMVITGFVAVRYILWRVNHSIPWQDDTFSLICALLLLGAEITAVVLAFMGAFVNINPLWREPIPVDMSRKDLPTVDVLIPSYNESEELLRTTLLAAEGIEYPREKLKVYLLDDGGTDAKCSQPGDAGETARNRRHSLQALCHEVGCFYVTRAQNNDAKAGNINAALKKTEGEVVLILDSDHIPTRDFLEQTIGTLVSDERIAFVQTPHFMINQDPLEKNLQAGAEMPSEGEMFYTLGLRGMDNWNAGFFCGSGALIRRSVLEEIGGIQTETIVEDAETSMEIISRGYKTAYLHRPLLAGLSTDTMDSYMVQRGRWATGMTQLFRLKNPLTKPGLNFAQRISYFNCIFYWLFTMGYTVFMLAPATAIIFGATLFATPPVEVFLYLIPHMTAIFLSANLLYGRVRWLFVSEVYETVQAFLISWLPFFTLLMPREKKFNVTPKGLNMDRDDLSPLSNAFYVLFAVQAAATIVGIYGVYSSEQGTNLYLVSLLWNLFNLTFTLAALGVMIERRQQRKNPRIPVGKVAQVRVNGKLIPCHIEEMSVCGATIRLPGWVNHIKQADGTLRFSSIVDSHASLTTMFDHLSELGFVINSQTTLDHGSEKTLRIHIEFNYQGLEERRAVVYYLYGDSEHWKNILKRRNAQSTLRQGLVFHLNAVRRGLQHLWMLVFGVPNHTSSERTAIASKGE